MKSLIMPTENFKNGKSVNNLDRREHHTHYILSYHNITYMAPKEKKMVRKSIKNFKWHS